LKFRKHVSRLVTTGAINVKKKPSEGDTSLCKESLLPKSRSTLKSFNSLLIKFNVSTQETSCQNFFSSLLYVREFFLDNSLVQEFFLTQMHLQDFFFQNQPPPPPPLRMVGPLAFPLERELDVRMHLEPGAHVLFYLFHAQPVS